MCNGVRFTKCAQNILAVSVHFATCRLYNSVSDARIIIYLQH